MDLPVDVDLTLGNVTSQVGNGVSDIVVRHRQDGNLSDRSVAALHTTGSLINGGQIGVHVTGEASSTRDLFSGGRDLTESLSVGGHVSEDDEHVLLTLIGQEFGRGQSQARRDDPLNGGIVGQVEEETDVLHGTVLFEVLLEESSGLHVDSHSGENDGEVILVIIQNRFSGQANQRSLTTDLGGNLVVRETVGREDGDLLASSNRVHDVNGRDTGLNHFLGIDSRVRVNGLTLKKANEL